MLKKLKKKKKISVLKQKIVLPKVTLIRHDEHVFPSFGELLSQEISSLSPFLQLLQTVGIVAAHTIRTAVIQPVEWDENF